MEINIRMSVFGEFSIGLRPKEEKNPPTGYSFHKKGTAICHLGQISTSLDS